MTPEFGGFAAESPTRLSSIGPHARIGETRLHRQAQAWGVPIHGNASGWEWAKTYSERGVAGSQRYQGAVEPQIRSRSIDSWLKGKDIWDFDI
jgi:hypothetical protein